LRRFINQTAIAPDRSWLEERDTRVAVGAFAAQFARFSSARQVNSRHCAAAWGGSLLSERGHPCSKTAT
jgi:hypothetical protein